MSKQGIERVPVSALTRKVETSQQVLAADGFDAMAMHFLCLRTYLGTDTLGHFRISDEALADYQRLNKVGLESGSKAGRSLKQVAMHFHVDRENIVNECRGKTVLDIGCGEGGFGKDLRYSGAKAEITVVERDPEVMKAVSEKIGRKVIANACDLPFSDQSFDDTFMLYSALTYPDSPVDSTKSLAEALRVTKPGGSLFLVPLCMDHTGVDAAMMVGGPLVPLDGYDYETSRHYFDVCAVRDYLVLDSLAKLIKSQRVNATLVNGVGKTKDEVREVLSAVIDINEPIPQEFLEQQIRYAGSFGP